MTSPRTIKRRKTRQRAKERALLPKREGGLMFAPWAFAEAMKLLSNQMKLAEHLNAK